MQWFGEGLGYGSWEYLDARLGTAGDAPAVTVSLQNTSGRSAREVVQVYFAPADPDQPVRLVGWSGLAVSPGQTAEVTVACDPRMWRRWDTGSGGWARLDGNGELLIARGLGDVRHRLRVTSAGQQA
jgi:beta-glucosidase